MRSSRVSVWAIGLLLGLSGCAGVRQQGAMPAQGGPVTAASAPSGPRGWFARRFGGGYAPAVHSQLGSIPPASAFQGASDGGWGAVHQFARPPWVTRQPMRSPIFGANTPRPNPTPAEINEAIARMTAGRRTDDQLLPVRNLNSPRPGADDDREVEPSSSPFGLPDALTAARPDEPDVDERPAADAEPTPSIPPAGAVLLGVRPVDEPAADGAGPPPQLATTEPETTPEPEPRTVPEPASVEAQDANLVRSAQAPPPPTIRPEPGARPAPAPVVPKPDDGPAPDVAPAPEEAPKPAQPPATEEAPALEPVEAPKAEEAPKPPAAPEVDEATKPAAPPTVEQAAEPATVEQAVKPATVEQAAKPAESSPPAPPTVPTPAPTDSAAKEEGSPEPAAQTPVRESTPVAQADAPQPAEPIETARTQIYEAPVAGAPATTAPRARRWSFWRWKTGGHATASPQSPASLPPATFPTSYESVWAKPLVPSPQSTPVVASPQAAPVAEGESCWLVDRLKARARKIKAWKEEHICKHIKNFKAALRGDRCHDCRHAVTASPQAVPSPQAAPTPQAKATAQEWPVIGGSRFGLY